MNTCRPSTRIRLIQKLVTMRSSSRSFRTTAAPINSTTGMIKNTRVSRFFLLNMRGAQTRRPEAGPLIRPSGLHNRMIITAVKVNASRNFSRSWGSVKFSPISISARM